MILIYCQSVFSIIVIRKFQKEAVHSWHFEIWGFQIIWCVLCKGARFCFDGVNHDIIDITSLYPSFPTSTFFPNFFRSWKWFDKRTNDKNGTNNNTHGKIAIVVSLMRRFTVVATANGRWGIAASSLGQQVQGKQRFGDLWRWLSLQLGRTLRGKKGRGERGQGAAKRGSCTLRFPSAHWGRKDEPDFWNHEIATYSTYPISSTLPKLPQNADRLLAGLSMGASEPQSHHSGWALWNQLQGPGLPGHLATASTVFNGQCFGSQIKQTVTDLE